MPFRGTFMNETNYVGTAFAITSTTETTVLTVAKALLNNDGMYAPTVEFTSVKQKTTEATSVTIKVYDNTTLLASLVQPLAYANNLWGTGTADYYKGALPLGLYVDPAVITTNIKVTVTCAGTSIDCNGFCGLQETRKQVK